MKSKLLKGSLLLAAGFLFQNQASAQLYVSPNSYVFANNEVVFVKQDMELNAATSNFYLRNDAQLLQGTAAAGANKGLGNLSVFQEGTVNNYQYNYWCSPVGNTASATAVNNPFGITQLKDVTGLTTSNNPTVSAWNNYDGTASPLTIAQYWIWKFVTSNAYSQWVQVGAATTVNAGEGFTMKGSSGTNATTVNGVQNNSGSKQRYDFRGKPNDGSISVAVSLNNFTLVGNPYPSAIDINLFLLDPSNAAVITGTAYFWEQVVVNSHYINAYQGGYGTYTPGAGYTVAAFNSYNGSGGIIAPTGSSGSAIERRFSPIGQGFMVKGSAAGSVTMKNTFRTFVKEGVPTFSQFARVAGTNDNPDSEYFPEIPNVANIDYTQIKKGYAPQLKINAMFDNVGVRPTTLAFDNSATDGFDYGWDGRSPSTENAEFYYVVDNDEYVASVVKFDKDKRIPLGFRCLQPTNFKVKLVDVLYGFDANQNVYIHDKETDMYHDIKNGMFDLTLPAEDNRTRFELTFKDAAAPLGTEEAVNQSFVVYQNNNTKNVTVSNPMQVELASCGLYDVAGKMIFSKKALGSNTSYEFSTANLSDGIYIVKLITKDNSEISKKIIIKN
ncbi:T9SS type A sorting domain-containing protein [Flavobacterium sp. GT3R68]|uniref:T9SS type A sorting domain-containing protein n=1 Tax=Flavobacterium sp. GT3R68 TaxID=2594437 RepID=UPI000F85DDA6|nr:T9SS type A sorting domain-containing protein [Flavobacterium sp. GT3R68]RTY90244.1 T9SS type A sorting domain-containing protein [Flavobacterium sp. GSN2]TRW90545.1 T9SS type A sorting domain-containing protein [Flavobacterium sp. GT3R68]